MKLLPSTHAPPLIALGSRRDSVLRLFQVVARSQFCLLLSSPFISFDLTLPKEERWEMPAPLLIYCRHLRSLDAVDMLVDLSTQWRCKHYDTRYSIIRPVWGYKNQGSVELSSFEPSMVGQSPVEMHKSLGSGFNNGKLMPGRKSPRFYQVTNGKKRHETRWSPLICRDFRWSNRGFYK